MTDPWEAIQNDPELNNARRKLSIHEVRLIIKHATAGTVPLATYEAAVRGRQEFRTAYRARALHPSDPVSTSQEQAAPSASDQSEAQP